MSPAAHQAPFSQTRRSMEHVAPLAFAFTLTIFPLWLVFLLSILSVIYGAYGSGKISLATFREEERVRGYSTGKIAYALSILVLLALFHRWIHVVAGAWAILALGDPAAALAGRRWGARPLPWNRSKTWVGSISFFFAGTIGCFVLLWYTRATGGFPTAASWPILLLVSAIASLVCGGVESLDLPVDDNFLVPGAAGVLLFLQTRWMLI